MAQRCARRKAKILKLPESLKNLSSVFDATKENGPVQFL